MRGRHVHEQLVLRIGGHGYRRCHLQIHRIPRVTTTHKTSIFFFRSTLHKVFLSLQCRERVGWRPPRSGLVRCTFQPSKAGGRPSAHQELAAADPHPHQIGLKVEREAQEHLLAGITVESRKRLTFKSAFCPPRNTVFENHSKKFSAKRIYFVHNGMRCWKCKQNLCTLATKSRNRQSLLCQVETFFTVVFKHSAIDCLSSRSSRYTIRQPFEGVSPFRLLLFSHPWMWKIIATLGECLREPFDRLSRDNDAKERKSFRVH